jgi:hypothetical protein
VFEVARTLTAIGVTQPHFDAWDRRHSPPRGPRTIGRIAAHGTTPSTPSFGLDEEAIVVLERFNQAVARMLVKQGNGLADRRARVN